MGMTRVWAQDAFETQKMEPVGVKTRMGSSYTVVLLASRILKYLCIMDTLPSIYFLFTVVIDPVMERLVASKSFADLLELVMKKIYQQAEPHFRKTWELAEGYNTQIVRVTDWHPDPLLLLTKQEVRVEIHILSLSLLVALYGYGSWPFNETHQRPENVVSNAAVKPAELERAS
jgi:hypothetical protein